MKLIQKRPDERLDYEIDFGRDWMPEDDHIVSIDVEIETDGTIALDGSDFGTTTAKVWVKGGADRDTATIVVRASTNLGRIKEYAFRLRVRDC